MDFNHTAPRKTKNIYKLAFRKATGLKTCEIFFIYLFRVPHQGESYSKTRRNIENLEFVPEFDRDKLSSRGKKFLKRCLR